MNEPRHYNLFLVTTTCRTCGEEYIYPDLMLARSIPKGEAYSPPKLDGVIYDIPVRKVEVRRDILFCTMCVDKAPKVTYVPVPLHGVLNVDILEAEAPEAGRDGGKVIVRRVPAKGPVIDLKALGLLDD